MIAPVNGFPFFGDSAPDVGSISSAASASPAAAEPTMSSFDSADPIGDSILLSLGFNRREGDENELVRLYYESQLLIDKDVPKADPNNGGPKFRLFEVSPRSWMVEFANADDEYGWSIGFGNFRTVGELMQLLIGIQYVRQLES